MTADGPRRGVEVRRSHVEKGAKRPGGSRQAARTAQSRAALAANKQRHADAIALRTFLANRPKGEAK